MLGGTDVGFAEACTNAHSGVRVVMCQTAAGSKQSNATVGSADGKYSHGPRGLQQASGVDKKRLKCLDSLLLDPVFNHSGRRTRSPAHISD